MKPIDNTNPPISQTVAEAVSFTGRSRSAIYKWLDDGRLKAKKDGRSVKIKTTDLMAMMNELPDR